MGCDAKLFGWLDVLHALMGNYFICFDSAPRITDLHLSEPTLYSTVCLHNSTAVQQLAIC